MAHNYPLPNGSGRQDSTSQRDGLSGQSMIPLQTCDYPNPRNNIPNVGHEFFPGSPHPYLAWSIVMEDHNYTFSEETKRGVENYLTQREMTRSSRQNDHGATISQESTSGPSSTPIQTKPPVFHRLEALAKAEVKCRPKGQVQMSGNPSNKFIPWVEKHLPNSADDLFVHKKKLEEVTHWISRVLQSPNASKICVVSGPSGSGKTAAVSLVAQGLDAEVKEWINPMSLTQYRPGQDFRDDVQGRNQLDLFTDFLFRTSQYRSLPIKGKALRKYRKYRVTLVEDIPNALYREPNTFHEILRKYSKSGISPLIFVFTDTASGEHSMFKMFPKTLMTELNIQNISFNPVASSYMVKFMLDICTKESIPVDKGLVEDLAATANGDMRCAVNNMQFSLTKERSSSSRKAPSRPQANKRSRKQAAGNPAISEVQQKDDNIQLFRALGKVLYAKRDETLISENEMILVGKMEKDRRIHPLIENPENICDKAAVSTDTFLGFLHQNYPAFYGSLDDMASAAEYLASSDYMMSAWKFDDSGARAYKVRETKEQLAMNIAVRGLMHSNNNRVSVAWKPLTKPLVSNLEKIIKESTETIRQGLIDTPGLTTALFTETIPFFAKVLTTGKPYFMLGPELKNEILNKGIFKGTMTRAVPLDEKETVEEGSDEPAEGDDCNVQEELGAQVDKPKGTPNKWTAKDLTGDPHGAHTDEELFIEEYDD
ncbi:unnamed protein product [Orchesella dallaii]|uniref:Cell cycle checkpoint protein RAD17 n=1 Tax=Orchesella dallaii TaxID=48710 RepID=A0ABP1RL13_9HEXA